MFWKKQYTSACGIVSNLRLNEKVLLKDIAQVIAPDEVLSHLQTMMIHQLTDADRNIVIIDVMKVIHMIKK